MNYQSKIDKLKVLLSRRLWTPEELAEKLGTTVRSVYRYLDALNHETEGRVRAVFGRPARYYLETAEEKDLHFWPRPWSEKSVSTREALIPEPVFVEPVKEPPPRRPRSKVWGRNSSR